MGDEYGLLDMAGFLSTQKKTLPDKNRLRGRRSAFARSVAGFVAALADPSCSFARLRAVARYLPG